ncbi:hypothetical protein JCM24511_04042 [Saitozyma sp. JCM 24511]|nr:hypothetical protein JCM24511_04042 [Saitozyma sp. JCM 24511]
MDPSRTMHFISNILLRPARHIEHDPWRGQPELTNRQRNVLPRLVQHEDGVVSEHDPGRARGDAPAQLRVQGPGVGLERPASSATRTFLLFVLFTLSLHRASNPSFNLVRHLAASHPPLLRTTRPTSPPLAPTAHIHPRRDLGHPPITFSQLKNRRDLLLELAPQEPFAVPPRQMTEVELKETVGKLCGQVLGCNVEIIIKLGKEVWIGRHRFWSGRSDLVIRQAEITEIYNFHLRLYAPHPSMQNDGVKLPATVRLAYEHRQKVSPHGLSEKTETLPVLFKSPHPNQRVFSKPAVDTHLPLDTGSFGVVHLAMHVEGRLRVACKTVIAHNQASRADLIRGRGRSQPAPPEHARRHIASAGCAREAGSALASRQASIRPFPDPARWTLPLA